jgi:hypothetical protein
LVVVDALPLDLGKEALFEEKDGLLEDQADARDDEFEDAGLNDDSDDEPPERRRYPADGEDFYYDAQKLRVPRYCTCAWDVFMKDHALDIECTANDCLYWFHVDCTSLNGMSKQQVEALNNWRCDNCSAN